MNLQKKIKLSCVSVLSAAAISLTGCASSGASAPIESIGPISAQESQGQVLHTSGLAYNKGLDSRSIKQLQQDIYNPGSYNVQQQQEMVQALANMSCKTVYFAFDSTRITDIDKSCLAQVANYLIKYKQPIRLAGHTDPRGSEKYNLNLGQRRGDSVRRYLLQQGVSSTQMCAISYGKSQPAANPQNLYKTMCSTDSSKACKSKAEEKAYYLDRRVQLGLGQKCR